MSILSAHNALLCLWLLNMRAFCLHRIRCLVFCGLNMIITYKVTECSLQLMHLDNNAFCAYTMLMIRFAGRTIHRDRLVGKGREEVNLFPGGLRVLSKLHTLGGLKASAVFRISGPSPSPGLIFGLLLMPCG